MHALKLVILMAVTLAIMRVISWGLGWALARWRPMRVGASSLASNTGGLLLFLGLLHWNRLPGEFLDLSAAVFGVVVYAVFAVVDLLWRPWNRRSVGRNHQNKG